MSSPAEVPHAANGSGGPQGAASPGSTSLTGGVPGGVGGIASSRASRRRHSIGGRLSATPRGALAAAAAASSGARTPPPHASPISPLPVETTREHGGDDGDDARSRASSGLSEGDMARLASIRGLLLSPQEQRLIPGGSPKNSSIGRSALSSPAPGAPALPMRPPVFLGRANSAPLQGNGHGNGLSGTPLRSTTPPPAPVAASTTSFTGSDTLPPARAPIHSAPGVLAGLSAPPATSPGARSVKSPGESGRQAARSQAEKDLALLREDLTISKWRLEEKDQALLKCVERVESLGADLVAARRLAALESQAARDAHNELKVIQEALSQRDAVIREQEERISDLESQLAASQRKSSAALSVSSSSQAAAAFEGAQSRIDDLTEQNSALQATVLALQEDISRRDAEHADARREISALRSTLAARDADMSHGAGSDSDTDAEEAKRQMRGAQRANSIGDVPGFAPRPVRVLPVSSRDRGRSRAQSDTDRVTGSESDDTTQSASLRETSSSVASRHGRRGATPSPPTTITAAPKQPSPSPPPVDTSRDTSGLRAAKSTRRRRANSSISRSPTVRSRSRTMSSARAPRGAGGVIFASSESDSDSSSAADEALAESGLDMSDLRGLREFKEAERAARLGRDRLDSDSSDERVKSTAISPIHDDKSLSPFSKTANGDVPSLDDIFGVTPTAAGAGATAPTRTYSKLTQDMLARSPRGSASSTPRTAATFDSAPLSLSPFDRPGAGSVAPGEGRRGGHSVASFLKSVPLLQSLDEAQLKRLAEGCGHEVFADGSIIIKQGDPGDKFYVVEEGEVLVYKKDSDISEPRRGKAGPAALGERVHRLVVSDFFGERALITNEKRAATCIASGEVHCLVLTREMFSEILSGVQVLLGEYSSYADEHPEVTPLSDHIVTFRHVLDSHDPTIRPVLDVLAVFAPEMELGDVVERAVRLVYGLIEVQRVAVFVVDGTTLHLKVSHDSRDVQLPLEGIVGHVALTGEMALLRDAKSDPMFSTRVDEIGDVETRSVLAVPVFASGSNSTEIAGVLQVVNSERSDGFTDTDVSLLEAVAQLLSGLLTRLREDMSLVATRQARPVWSVDDPLALRVSSLNDVRLDEAKGGLFGGSSQAFVAVALWHGLEELCPAVVTSKVTLTTTKHAADGKRSGFLAGDAVIDGDIEFDISVRDVPRAARIIVTVFKGDRALGWAGCPVFRFDEYMHDGDVTLRLWPGACPSSMRTCLENIVDESSGTVVLSFGDARAPPVLFSPWGEPLVRDDSLNLQAAAKSTKLSDELVSALNTPMLEPLTSAQKHVIWEGRYRLSSVRKALPRFLQSVNWASRDAVAEAYRLLAVWEPPGPLEALQLLDWHYPDPSVRAYAVCCLERLPDDNLRLFMLQLTQALKFEPFHDSSLARFLLRRALINPRILGHNLFWLLKAELHDDDARDRCGALLEIYVRNCGAYRTGLGHQMFVMRKLSQVANAVKKLDTSRHSRRIQLARQLLSKIVFPERFQLPIDPDFEACGVVAEKCRVMSSKKLPLLLVFRGAGQRTNKDGQERTLSVLFKKGDDLRQDQLTLQILRVMVQLWNASGLDLRMSPYACISTGNMLGMLEIVPDSETISNIHIAATPSHLRGMKRLRQAANNVFKNEVIAQWLKEECRRSKDFADSSASSAVGGAGGAGGGSAMAAVVSAALEKSRSASADETHGREATLKQVARRLRAASSATQIDVSLGTNPADASFTNPYLKAQRNFARSCAGYVVATHVLGIGDRHCDNIMLSRSGKLFHIDFGHFLGNFKSKMGIKRERAPFVFTPSMAHVLGTEEGEPYRMFLDLATRAFEVLRRHHDLLVTLFMLMLSCGIPELTEAQQIAWVPQKLALDKTESEARSELLDLIHKALHTKATQYNDYFHILKHANNSKGK